MINLEDIRQAHARIQPIAHRTPVLTSRHFNALTGVHASFKCENFQRGGAFKIRGAANFVYSIPKQDLPRGVVAFSSGNHAQAVAIAAASIGTPATIIMPTDAPQSKVQATRGYGAKIVPYDRMKEDREILGRQISAETGATLVPPYDHEWTITGQGTVALELLEEIPNLEALAICCGGGGLLAGCSIAAKALNPDIRIFGVEPADGNDTFLSFQKQERVEIPPPTTSADGLRAQKPGALTFPIVQKHVEKIVLVSEDEIWRTMAFCLSRMKMLVEPSGAVAAAAVMSGKLPAGLKRVGIVVSGGNVDLDLLARFQDPQFR